MLKSSVTLKTQQAFESSRLRILIIDDDESVLFALGRLLGKHEVKLAHGSRAGIETLRRGDEFDAVVCDVSMPGLTGPALYAAIISEKPELAQRFVFVTGTVDLARTLMESHIGAGKFIPPVLEKPIDTDALLSEVEALQQYSSTVLPAQANVTMRHTA